MQCPVTSEHWQHYQDTGDSAVANHLASCAVCREEAARMECLQQALASLAVPEPSDELAARVAALSSATQGATFSCAQVQTLLDPWLAGELDRVHSFLIEDHLLWCESCAVEVARADALLAALRDIPQVTAPAAIAERLAAARVPWWQKWLPAPAPAWSRMSGLAASMAAGLVLAFVSTLLLPQLAHTPEGRQPVVTVAAKPPTHRPAPLSELKPPATVACAPRPVTQIKRPRPIVIDTGETNDDTPVTVSHVAEPPNELDTMDEQPALASAGTDETRTAMTVPGNSGAEKTFTRTDYSAKRDMTLAIARESRNRDLMEKDADVLDTYNL